MFVVATVLVVVAELLPVGDYLKAAVGVPASVLLFLIGLGAAHKQHLDRGTPTMKERYSHKQRLSRAGAGLVGLLIVSILSSNYIPYALGGVILLTGVFGLINLVRMTPLEQEMAREGVVDPRDRAVQQDAEPEEVIDDGFSWDDEEELNYSGGETPEDALVRALQEIQPLEIRSVTVELVQSCEARGIPLPAAYPIPNAGGVQLEWIDGVHNSVAYITDDGETTLVRLDADYNELTRDKNDAPYVDRILSFVAAGLQAGDSSRISRRGR